MLIGRLQTSDEEIPYEIMRAFRAAPDPICSEQKLWIEVACRLALDAIGETGESEPDEHEEALLAAWRWWAGSIEDVHETLDLAGIDRELRGVMVTEINRLRPKLKADVTDRYAKFAKAARAKSAARKIQLTTSPEKTTRESTKRAFKLVIKKKRKGVKRR